MNIEQIVRILRDNSGPINLGSNGIYDFSFDSLAVKFADIPYSVLSKSLNKFKREFEKDAYVLFERDFFDVAADIVDEVYKYNGELKSDIALIEKGIEDGIFSKYNEVLAKNPTQLILWFKKNMR